MIITIILTIAMIMLITVPHEFGHLITAKLFGIRVNEFAVGMGPVIAEKSHGGTQYSLRAIPVGGFCAMEAENEASEEEGAFNNKPAWQRLIVLFAGAAMNILVAILLMIIITTVAGVPTNTLGEVKNNSPAEAAGMLAGDEIISINGSKTQSWQNIVETISRNGEGKPLEFVVMRDDKLHTVDVTPKLDKDKRVVIGIVSRPSHNLLLCAGHGVKATWNINKAMLGALRGLVRKGISKNDVTGPVGMVSLVNETTHSGGLSYLYLVALISLNMAIINLLPFPALDGGRIIFVIIRRITGSVISDKVESYMHLAGFAFLMLVFVVVTWQDIARIFG